MAGRYDPLHMNRPCGITVDPRGRLWVAEEDERPKRLSVWNSDGTLADAFYGPAGYGEGGTLDPRDRTAMYYYGMRLRLDYDAGASVPEAVVFRPDEKDVIGRGFSGREWPAAPQRPIYANGRRYLTNCYNVSPTNGAYAAGLWLPGEDDVARPVAAAGQANVFPFFRDLPKRKGEADADAFLARLPAGADLSKSDTDGSVFFAWRDTDGDGLVSPAEVTFVKSDSGRVEGVTAMPDLSFVVTVLNGRSVRFAAGLADARGVPGYDFAAGEVLVENPNHPTTTGGGQTFVADGWVFQTVAPSPLSPLGLGGVRDGRPTWSYPSLWPGLHASHAAPLPAFPGETIGTTRLLGPPVVPRGSDVGPIFAVNGNKGNVYLLTADGLFVATLLRDSRTTAWTFPQERRGMSVADASLQEESFWPSITQLEGGGEIVLQAHSAVLKTSGLEQVRRLPERTITLTAAHLAEAAAWSVKAEADRQAAEADDAGPLVVSIRKDPPTVDGDLADWAGATWVTIDVRRQQEGDWGRRDVRTEAAVAVSGDRLYAAFRTGEADLLRSAGGPIQTLFKSGGALDLMLGNVPGGQRLLVTRVKDETLAVLYRPVDPDAPGEPAKYVSNLGALKTVTVDRVQDVTDRVRLAADGKGNYELSVPLALLRLDPKLGGRVKGDVGLLRGNGLATLQRAYWHNKAAGLVSDLASEAELTPALWGEWRFEAAE